MECGYANAYKQIGAYTTSAGVQQGHLFLAF